MYSLNLINMFKQKFLIMFESLSELIFIQLSEEHILLTYGEDFLVLYYFYISSYFLIVFAINWDIIFGDLKNYLFRTLFRLELFYV